MLYDPNWKPLSKTGLIASRAADLIEEHGHLKHYLGDKNQGFCLLGAVMEASRESHQYYGPLWCAISEQVSARVGDRVSVPAVTVVTKDTRAIKWNNHEDTTKEEVIQILREVAHVV